MFQYHKEAIEKLIDLFTQDQEVIAIGPFGLWAGWAGWVSGWVSGWGLTWGVKKIIPPNNIFNTPGLTWVEPRARPIQKLEARK
jgi:hypothetical protein